MGLNQINYDVHCVEIITLGLTEKCFVNKMWNKLLKQTAGLFFFLPLHSLPFRGCFCPSCQSQSRINCVSHVDTQHISMDSLCLYLVGLSIEGSLNPACECTFLLNLSLHTWVQRVCVCVTHHVGLPGLLYVVCGDDDRDFPRLHDLHQMLPDPRKETREKTNKLHNTWPAC